MEGQALNVEAAAEFGRNFVRFVDLTPFGVASQEIRMRANAAFFAVFFWSDMLEVA
jgi:hypothetical protein